MRRCRGPGCRGRRKSKRPRDREPLSERAVDAIGGQDRSATAEAAIGSGRHVHGTAQPGFQPFANEREVLPEVEFEVDGNRHPGGARIAAIAGRPPFDDDVVAERCVDLRSILEMPFIGGQPAVERNLAVLSAAFPPPTNESEVRRLSRGIFPRAR